MTWLLTSDRWAGFLESTAVGLHLSLTFLLPEGVSQIHAPATCPACRRVCADLTPEDAAKALNTPSTGPAPFCTEDGAAGVAMPLQDGLFVVARDCPCIAKSGRYPPLQDRAGIAQKLLTSFQAALSEGNIGGRRAVELLTIHQMNHIILSLFQGEDEAMGRSFDLILSALVILLDAKASWLAYTDGAGPNLLIKGDREAVDLYLRDKAGPAVVVELKSGNVSGQLGVCAPADATQADSLLPLMVQECLIVFEVYHLFQVMRTRLTQVLGAVGSAVLLIDRHGVVTYANGAAEHLLGRQALDMIGRPAAYVPGPWTPFLAAKPAERVDGRLDPLGQDPGCRWVDWQIGPVWDGETALGWLVLADDRTDYHRWQETARQADRLATTATMVGALAHEIRNPLGAARALLQLLGSKREPDKVRGFADLISRELDRVSRLLNEFLLLGRPADIAPEPLDLAVLLQELRPLLEGEAAAQGAELLMETETVPAVAADPGQLTQMVLNLVRNGVEAAGRLGRVQLTLEKTADGVTLAVRDNGPGLSPVAIQKMFRPFFTTKVGGTGLGLPVVQAIVHNHGGRIAGTNAPGGGAVFTIYFLAQTKDRENSCGANVVIAASDDMVRYPAEQALRAAGFSVTATEDLAGAVFLTERCHPVVVVLDIPALTRQDVEDIQRVGPGVRVVITGEPDGLVGMERLHYLPKPIDYAGLICKVQALRGEALDRN
ncbi:MAG TPA: ATP-binding protein [Spirochaetia bacterium]|nr:ATP-binding protein [Spirochaetia bacterium]